MQGRWSRSWVGLTGQIFSFAAMFLPIFAAKFSAVTEFTIISAFANIFFVFFNLSSGQIIPRLARPSQVTIALFSSLTLILVALIVGLFGVFYLYFFSAVIFAAAQAFYSLIVSVCVRLQDNTRIYLMRFFYGVGVFASSLTCVFFDSPGFVYALAFSAVLFGSSLFFVRVLNQFFLIKRIRRILKPGFTCHSVRYVIRQGAFVFGHILANMAFQVGAFALPFLGGFQDAWSIVLRVSGGIATTLAQLIAPNYDGVIAFQVRASNRSGAYAIVARVGGIGAAIGVAVCLIVFLLFFVLNKLHTGADIGLEFSVSVLIYCVGVSVVSLSGRHLGIFNLPRLYFWLAASKLFISVALLVFCDQKNLLLLLSASEFLFALIPFVMLKKLVV